MSPLYTIVSLAFVIVSGLLVTVILLQKKRSKGLSALGAASSQTYYGKNKSRSKEGQLEKYTVVLGVLFFLLAVTMSFVS